ncbi:MAG: pectinesterase, partial [Paenibacillus sp.]|nr:pectinesterase [Paenibacillus sp.]
YMKQYERTGDLSGPLTSRLTNDLKQAKHHLGKGGREQAIRFLDKFLNNLNGEQEGAVEPITSEAQWMLDHYAELLMDRLA